LRLALISRLAAISSSRAFVSALTSSGLTVILPFRTAATLSSQAFSQGCHLFSEGFPTDQHLFGAGPLQQELHYLL
jgi:hypothetical protein